jgi:putative acetyltransferase
MRVRIRNADPQGEEALALLRGAALDVRPLYSTSPVGPPWPTNPALGRRGVYVMAELGEGSIACGAIRELDETTAEIQRMYVHREHRRSGVGRAILDNLLAQAQRLGYTCLRLETGNRQAAAMAFYESLGFHRIAPWGNYVNDPTSVCYARSIPNAPISPPQDKPLVTVRPAIEEDAIAIAHVHYSAVHQLASASYSPDVLNAWSPVPDDRRCRQFRAAIVGGKELFRVAEDCSGTIAFGSIVPAADELRAVYAHASAARRGVGSAIVQSLEALAASLSCNGLQMEASTNAAEFYRRHGFVVVETSIRRLSAGPEMGCVRMRKDFLSAANRPTPRDP